MNKEQFKFSISNLINYYVNNIVQLNLDLAGQEDENIKSMIANQANMLGTTFSNRLDDLINMAFPEEDEADE